MRKGSNYGSDSYQTRERESISPSFFPEYPEIPPMLNDPLLQAEFIELDIRTLLS